MPLHGRLSVAEQSRAFRPASAGRTKVVVATDVAEASVTIPDCTNVIDCGLARSVVGEAWSARAARRVVTGRVSADAAKQRAGRAGRVRAGTCWRLWCAVEQDEETARPPEMATLPLCGVALRAKSLFGGAVAPLLAGLPDAAAVGPGGGGGAQRAVVEICVEINLRRAAPRQFSTESMAWRTDARRFRTRCKILISTQVEMGAPTNRRRRCAARRGAGGAADGPRRGPRAPGGRGPGRGRGRRRGARRGRGAARPADAAAKRARRGRLERTSPSVRAAAEKTAVRRQRRPCTAARRVARGERRAGARGADGAAGRRRRGLEKADGALVAAALLAADPPLLRVEAARRAAAARVRRLLRRGARRHAAPVGRLRGVQERCALAANGGLRAGGGGRRRGVGARFPQIFAPPLAALSLFASASTPLVASVRTGDEGVERALRARVRALAGGDDAQFRAGAELLGRGGRRGPRCPTA